MVGSVAASLFFIAPIASAAASQHGKTPHHAETHSAHPNLTFKEIPRRPIHHLSHGTASPLPSARALTDWQLNQTLRIGNSLVEVCTTIIRHQQYVEDRLIDIIGTQTNRNQPAQPRGKKSDVPEPITGSFLISILMPVLYELLSIYLLGIYSHRRHVIHLLNRLRRPVWQLWNIFL